MATNLQAVYLPVDASLPPQSVILAPYAVLKTPDGYVLPMGPLGPTGPAGTAGPAGATGRQGIQGIQGIQGQQGIQGPQGIQGRTGATGPQGQQGIQGPQGATGQAGVTTVVHVHVNGTNPPPTGARHHCAHPPAEEPIRRVICNPPARQIPVHGLPRQSKQDALRTLPTVATPVRVFSPPVSHRHTDPSSADWWPAYNQPPPRTPARRTWFIGGGVTRIETPNRI